MTTIQKRITRPLHRKVAIWQRAACGLFALAVAGNCVLYGVAAHQEERAIQAEASAERWQGGKIPLANTPAGRKDQTDK